MKLVTAAQMRDIDRAAIEQHGIPSSTLMENAGQGIADYFLMNLVSGEAQSVAVFCGKGNNGGDGLVVARHIFEAEIPVKVYFLGPTAELSEDARLNYDRALRAGVPMIEITAASNLPEYLEADLIVDAIFGTGFTGAPRGMAAAMIEYINSLVGHVTIVSADLPSGLNADTGTHEGPVIQATCTCTLGLPKLGLYLSPGRELSGTKVIVPIGIPEEVLAQHQWPLELIQETQISEWLPKRKPDGHKGDFGRLFVLAGSTGMTGAAALSSMAAMRSGTGLVKVGCPSSTQPVLAIKVSEATTAALPEVRRHGVLALRSLGEIRKLIREHDAAVIGPGLGRHHETSELMRRLIPELDRPAIIDADGLNAFEGALELLEKRGGAASLVLTPHPGEFKRLTGVDAPGDLLARAETALEFAARIKAVLVLKGSPTLVADPGGTCYLNPTGNSGMATGGSGDVLSGMIGAFLAQGAEPLTAALLAVYLHGMAGDKAAHHLTERSLIAGDIITFLSEAFAEMETLRYGTECDLL